MPQITIPLGSKIDQTEKNQIQIRIPNTKFWIVGKRKTNFLWDAYLVDPQTNRRQLIKENASTKSFSNFSNIVLKTPFPYEGKNRVNSVIIKKFLKKLIN